MSVGKGGASYLCSPIATTRRKTEAAHDTESYAMDNVPTASHASRGRSWLLVAGAISVGVHAGLAPQHLHEWAPLGAAFVVAAVTGSAAVAALALRPASPWPPRLLGVLFGGLIAAYALTRLFALSPLDPTREPLDLIGTCTGAVEATGLVVALRLNRPRPVGRLPIALTPGGTQ